MGKTYELSALVRAEDAEDLLAELADDPRVKTVTLALGDSKYLVPNRGPISVAPPDQAGDA